MTAEALIQLTEISPSGGKFADIIVCSPNIDVLVF